MNAARRPLDSSVLAARKRTGWPRVLLGAALSLSTALAYAEDILGKQRYFEITAQALDTALLEFSKQANVQVMVDAETLRGYRTLGVRGTEAARTALVKLLADSGLTFAVVGSAVQVRPATTTHQQNIGRSESTTRLARLEYAKQAATQSANSESIQQPALRGVDEASGRRREPLDEVVVTGTHIRGIANRTAPMIAFDEQYIAATGASTVQDFFDSLPQNFGGGAQGLSEDGIWGNDNSRFNNFTATTALNLRGLGPSSTLVLVNGQRRAPSVFGTVVDVSLLPLASVERIEVLTDGSSAIYGSDAVAGAVNIILKEDYEGPSTLLRYGTVTKGDRQERLISQTLGANWSRGDAVLAFQYQDFGGLSAEHREFASAVPLPSDLLPHSITRTVGLNVRHRLSDSVEVFGSTFGSYRDIKREFRPLATRYELEVADAKQGSGTIGAELEFGGEWSITPMLQHSREEATRVNRRTTTAAQALVITGTDVDSKIASADVVVQGPLFQVPGGMVRAAFGSSYRDEHVSSVTLSDPIPRAVDRSVAAGFGEIYFPIVGAHNRRFAFHTLELSVAARYDDYSDFGSTTNPRFGLLWSPHESLSFRASYSESFRAPNAAEQIRDRSNLFLQIRNLANPNGPGNVPAFALFGGGEGLEPEEAETVSAGFTYTPHFAEGVALTFNYYDINYVNRIITPPFDAGALMSPETYGPLITTLSSDAEAQAFLASRADDGATILDSLGRGATGVRYIYDDRQQNVAAVSQSGFDIGIDYLKDFHLGTLSGRVNATVINKIDTSLGNGTRSVDLVDSIANPVGFRFRLDFGWKGNGWSANAAVNYLDNYVNTTLIIDEPIDSWTTLDVTANLEPATLMNRSLLDGVSVGLTIRNVLDRSPPFVQAFTPTSPAYDSANANPLGRFIGMELRKEW